MSLTWREHHVWSDPQGWYEIESTAHGSFVAHSTAKSSNEANYFRDEFPALEQAKARCVKHFEQFGSEFEDPSSAQLGT
jgi:hypothetical protein